ncbi:nitroreductase family protein [Paenibacillus sp. MMS18-CY102]|uniref:nitroreductase family protein n=1 Tax=Paenibacillus sp. MMS18-CY102 TaxID=2682849 RepID=UPI001365C26B|nr:nitroreductase family protein [Paenibacillus sp. MMS18-CY102]MWC27940.1 nitroreductase [Paenibacillus sp. MMS18-CY102]
MANTFLSAVKKRRSYYGISKEQVISEQQIQEIVEEAVKYSPSSFNSQSARVVLLFNEQSDKFWDLTTEVLRGIVGDGDQFESTAQKMASFRNGSGTVLFFEDSAVVEGLQKQFPSYADNFPIWSGHSSGMLQFVVWTALEQEGLGASLQHYNPIVDADVKKEWNVPDNWKLVAQMPFGKPAAEPGEKQFQPIEERVKVFK